MQLPRSVTRRLRPIRPLVMPFRHLGLTENDTLLACYPRSGSTWLRFMLVEILVGGPTEFGPTFRAFIPYVGRHRRAMRLLPGGGRLIKTHERYRPAYDRSKVMLLVRDPRDALLSEYRHRGKPGSFASFLRGFLDGRHNPYNPFGPWGDHTRGWLDSPPARDGRLLVVRYEDLRQKTEQALHEILDFLGVSSEPDRVEKAVADNRIDRLRQREERAKAGAKGLPEKDRMVHTGRVEGWRELLTESHVSSIEQFWGDVLERLGYPLS